MSDVDRKSRRPRRPLSSTTARQRRFQPCSGSSVCGMVEFQTAVEEIFDVQLLGGFQFPEVMSFHKDTLHHTFIVPDAAVSLQDNWAGQRGYGDERRQVGASWRAADRLNDLRVPVA
jgi:hypothetical protein